MRPPPIWQYGLTTVIPRRETTLPITLKSLEDAGFPKPRLFIDGWDGREDRGEVYSHFGCTYTTRNPITTPFLNWWLALVELYGRNPTADRYAIFQDDFVTYRNLRSYLDRQQYPEKGYWNLYTAFALNEPVIEGKPIGWYEAAPINRHKSRANEIIFQGGKGAVALVFDNDAVVTLLSSRSLVMKPRSADRRMAARRIDGGIVTAMNLAGWREFIHNPSLVQHIGYTSVCGNGPQALAQSFRGETFDAMELLKERAKV